MTWSEFQRLIEVLGDDIVALPHPNNCPRAKFLRTGAIVTFRPDLPGIPTR